MKQYVVFFFFGVLLFRWAKNIITTKENDGTQVVLLHLQPSVAFKVVAIVT